MGNIQRRIGRTTLLVALCLGFVGALTVAQVKHAPVAHAASYCSAFSSLSPSASSIQSFGVDLGNGNTQIINGSPAGNNWGLSMGSFSWGSGSIDACNNSYLGGPSGNVTAAYDAQNGQGNPINDALGNLAFQCVELIDRYDQVRWLDNWTWKDAYLDFKSHPPRFAEETNGQTGELQAGDILVWPQSIPNDPYGYNPDGHIGIIATVTKDSNGIVTNVTTLEQNFFFGSNVGGDLASRSIPVTYTNGLYSMGNAYYVNGWQGGMDAPTGWLHNTWGTTGANLRGDFNGDGKADMAAAYDYGNATTGIWIWTGASGLGSHIEAWKSAAGGWDASKTKWVVGDFNGDGKADLAGIYDDGNDAISIWIWLGTANGYLSSPIEAWSCSSNCWSWNSSAPTVGDFNGDGKDDLAIAYNYGSANTAIWVWPGISASPYLGARSKVWTSPTGGWDWTKTKWATGDFNGDGKADIAGVYDYGNGTTAIEVWPGTASGYLAAPTQVWECGPSCWTWANSTPIAGDFNGDGKTDLAIIYDYGSGTTGIWVWQGMSSGYLGNQSKVWQCGPNCWTDSHTKWASGDYNGDGFDDLMGMYDYGSGTTGVWIWSGAASNELTNRSEPWQCGPNCWTWADNTVAEAQ